MNAAFDELVSLGGAVQLTPGNHPTPEFEEHVRSRSVGTRRHHGFDFAQRRREVWAADGACLVDVESIHPPRDDSPAAARIRKSGVAAWLESREREGPLLETMYPGYILGTGDELEAAMTLDVPLAIDVSHVFMQLRQGAMTEATWKRLAEYEHVGEVHVSANAGTHDSHAPLGPDTFGLAWARERIAAGIPTVLECYMFRLSHSERAAQIDLLLGGS